MINFYQLGSGQCGAFSRSQIGRNFQYRGAGTTRPDGGKRLGNHFRYIVPGLWAAVVSSNRPEKRLLIKSVEHFGPVTLVQGSVDTTGDQQEGLAVGVGVCDPGTGVTGSRSRDGQRDSHLPGGPCPATGHHGGRLFVANQHVADLRIGAVERIVERQILGSRHAKQSTHALSTQTRNQQVGTGHSKSQR